MYKGKLYNLERKFKPGDKIYYRACIYYIKGAVTDFGTRVIAGIDHYYDFTSKTTVYPNQGHESAQYSFIY
jgi:hypothetical protein